MGIDKQRLLYFLLASTVMTAIWLAILPESPLAGQLRQTTAEKPQRFTYRKIDDEYCVLEYIDRQIYFQPINVKGAEAFAPKKHPSQIDAWVIDLNLPRSVRRLDFETSKKRQEFVRFMINFESVPVEKLVDYDPNN